MSVEFAWISSAKNHGAKAALRLTNVHATPEDVAQNSEHMVIITSRCAFLLTSQYF